MNHDISHCTGIKGDALCESCQRLLLHRELQRMVKQSRAGSGKVYQYVKAADCKEGNYSFRLP